MISLRFGNGPLDAAKAGARFTGRPFGDCAAIA